MAKQKIIIAPHEVLRKTAKPIERMDTKIAELIQHLADTLRATTNPQGVGLAAPQIKHSWRAFVTQLEDERFETPPIKAFINPKIIDQADRKIVGSSPRNPDLEGCLSLPWLYGPVLRPEWITLTWQELTPTKELSEWHTATFFDFTGRVIQHELDHLNGVLFVDHILEQGQPLYRSEKDDLIAIEPELARGY